MCAKAYSKSDHCVDLLEASEHRNVMMHFEEGIFGAPVAILPQYPVDDTN